MDIYRVLNIAYIAVVVFFFYYLVFWVIKRLFLYYKRIITNFLNQDKETEYNHQPVPHNNKDIDEQIDEFLEKYPYYTKEHAIKYIKSGKW